MTTKRRIPLLVPPQKSIGQNGLPIVVYIRSDEEEPRIWFAADQEEAAEIERFCQAAESFDIDDPDTHVVEF